MSVLDRQGIPESLLCNDSSRLEFENALAPLIDFALITSEADREYFGMHRLVQLATRTWLHRHEKIREKEEEAVTLLSETFPKGEYENWEMCRALLPHAEVMLEYQYSKQCYCLQQAEVLYVMAWYLHSQGNYNRAFDMNQRALKTRRQFFKAKKLM